ncbi:hypothetical protein Ddc_02110 [Ditylenchus destructor]|nr:hypothetical protein Ddc_02110 [Ditylenchus destructor]
MALHFCDLQQNLVMGRASCCQFVRLLNDTSRIALCDETQMKEEPSSLNAANLTEITTPISKPAPSISEEFMAMISNVSSQRNATSRVMPNSLSQVLVIKANDASALQHHYTTPVYLKIPSDVPEDHVTFMFGILFLVSIAVLCTMFILRITKPKHSYSMNNRYGNPFWDYDLMLWLRPNGTTSRQRSRRRSSLLFFLRGATCRIGNSHGTRRTAMRNSVSIVSTSSINALPVYRPTHSPSSLLSTCSSIVPPPAYEELEQLTTSILSNNATYADRFLQPPIIIDRNNNNNGPIRILN